MDNYTGQWQIRTREFKTEIGRAEQRNDDFHIITQNVMGFKLHTRDNWMRSWKTSSPISQVIFLQETHLVTAQEAEEADRTWQ